MVFDEDLRTCITEQQFKQYHDNQACKAEPLDDKYKHLVVNKVQNKSDYSFDRILESLRKIFPREWLWQIGLIVIIIMIFVMNKFICSFE